MPGEPRWLQRHKILRAKNRRRLARWFRCKIGRHNPPWNQPYEEMGAIMIAGSCTRCDDPIIREVAYLGDIWDFPHGFSQEGNSTVIHPNAMDDVIDAYVRRLLR